MTSGHTTSLGAFQRADDPVIERGEDAAYMFELRLAHDAIEVAAQLISGKTDDSAKLAAAAHLLVAAWADRNRLLGIVSPGFTRTGDFAVRALKPKPRVVE